MPSRLDIEDNAMSVGTQTDLTMVDLAVLESGYQQRMKELSKVCSEKGFPDRDNLKNDEKLLHFYTGVSTYGYV